MTERTNAETEKRTSASCTDIETEKNMNAGRSGTELEKLMAAENARRKEDAGEYKTQKRNASMSEYHFFHLDEITAELGTSAGQISKARKLIDRREIWIRAVQRRKSA